MTDQAELKVASKEQIAYKLAIDIAGQENLLSDNSTYRKKLLDLYAECLSATSGFRRNGE
jgi:hypothetical protein